MINPKLPIQTPLSMNLAYESEDFSKYDTSNIPDDKLTWSSTVCPYCGVGCGLLAGTLEGQLHKIRGSVAHPANRGLLCAKGATLAQVVDTPDRLGFPMLRGSRDLPFEKITWGEAFNAASSAIRSTIERYGPDSFAFYISGQILSEDYYVINKLAKGFLGTNNVDSNSRLCMASAVAGYTTSLGADGPPACYDDIELADCFFLIGTNTAACHPVTFQRIKARKMKDPKNVQVIVADPRRTATSDIADLHLSLRPGSDVALLNGMLHVLEKEGMIDQDFIDDHTNGWQKIQNLLFEYTPKKSGRICGVEPEEIIRAALLFGRSKSALSLWSMGVNQSTSGTAKNNSIINLHLATGKIGKPGSGPFSLTGQPNAMGGRETGGLCHLLPGHRQVASDKHRGEMESFWNIPQGQISAKPGLNAVELFEAVHAGKVKVLWVIATNPAVSLPDAVRIKEALKHVDYFISQDTVYPTETSQFAHLVLPAAQWAERDGTVTNSERRISYLSRLIDPPGQAKPDWLIVTELARRLGFGQAFQFSTAEDIFEEYKNSTRGTDMDLSGVSYSRLKKQPLQWPCPDPGSSGTARLYEDKQFHTPDGRARFIAHEYRAPAEETDTEFPMILTTGRVRDQWHTMTRTGKVDMLLRSEPYAFVEIHPEDAVTLGVVEGQTIEVVTRRGRVRAPARVIDKIRRGTCFIPFHWGELFGEAVANRATTGAFDPVSKQPELKFCACRIESVNDRLRGKLL